jgi:hypothetical protein
MSSGVDGPAWAGVGGVGAFAADFVLGWVADRVDSSRPHPRDVDSARVATASPTADTEERRLRALRLMMTSG